MMGFYMIKKNINYNLPNDVDLNDIECFFKLTEKNKLEKIFDLSEDINRKNFEKISYECNIYYPTIYQIEDNCPTCGYRTKESRRKYTEDFIIKSIEHKLENIENYPISGINCYNKDISGIRELMFILNALDKKNNLKINVRVSNFEHVKHLKNYNINSIIIQSTKNKPHAFNKNTDENIAKLEEETIKYIKENMNLKVTYEFLINYGESYEDILNKILEIKKYNVDYIEIVGYDPFIDSPEEYNPQYTKEYILKIIALLRITFPNKELKIQYATNGNNFIEEYKKIGINTITGIYTKNLNSNLENTHILDINKN